MSYIGAYKCLRCGETYTTTCCLSLEEFENFVYRDNNSNGLFDRDVHCCDDGGYGVAQFVGIGRE